MTFRSACEISVEDTVENEDVTEMNNFKAHLAKVLADVNGIDEGDNIEAFVISIEIEYADWLEAEKGRIREGQEYEQMLIDDLSLLRQAQRV